MFVFGGYIDMRGATDELWQYELGECLFHCTENQYSVDTIANMLLISCACGQKLPEYNFKILMYLLQDIRLVPPQCSLAIIWCLKSSSPVDCLGRSCFHSVFPCKLENFISSVSLSLSTSSTLGTDVINEIQNFAVYIDLILPWTGYVRLLTRITCIFGLVRHFEVDQN